MTLTKFEHSTFLPYLIHYLNLTDLNVNGELHIPVNCCRQEIEKTRSMVSKLIFNIEFMNFEHLPFKMYCTDS